MSAETYVPLDDIIGNSKHLMCEESVVLVRGLSIKCWKYSNSAVAQKSPIFAVHGGPAFTHNYMLPLKILCDDGYPLIFYDQGGCGDSTFVSDPATVAPWLLTISYYVEELAAVVRHYSPLEYHLYGSSWGTVVQLEYAIAAIDRPHDVPAGLVSMMLDGALCDGQVYIQTQWRDRISTLPTYTQKILKGIIKNGSFDSPIAKQIDFILSYHFTCRTIPRPDVLETCFKKMNSIIYKEIQGPSEFALMGVLENWSVTARLHEIRGESMLTRCFSRLQMTLLNTVPTLVLVGEFDTMTLECSEVSLSIAYALI